MCEIRPLPLLQAYVAAVPVERRRRPLRGIRECALITLSRSAPRSVSSGRHGIVRMNVVFRAVTESMTM